MIKMIPIFKLIDLEAELEPPIPAQSERSRINIGIADELSFAELTGNYFDLIRITPDKITFRYGNEVGLISHDGKMRLVTRYEKPEKAINTFRLLISKAKKMSEFDEESGSFNFDIFLCLLFESKRGPVNTILDFIRREKIEYLSKILGETVCTPTIGVRLREYGKSDSRAYMEIDVEPDVDNISRYKVEARYTLRRQRGISGLPSYIQEMVSKASSIVNLLESEGHNF
jgi:hypothetical protein